MKKNRSKQPKKLLLGLILVLVGVALLIFSFINNNARRNEANEGLVVREGEVVCLPHKNTDGPQTLECAFGLKLDDGNYWSLADENNDHSLISSLPTGKRVKLMGEFKSQESDRYKSIGILTVSKVEQLD